MRKVFMLFASLFVLAACSNTSTTPSSKTQSNEKNDKMDGYIYRDPKSVLFLKFTNKDGNLSGSYYDRWEDPNNQFQTYDSPLTGQIDGNSISINFKASGHTFTGNVSDKEIDLAVPQNDGTVSSLAFKPGTLTDFNKYVEELQSTVAKDQQSAQQAKQSADSNKQLSDLENKINTEMQTIQENDAKTLQSDVQSTGTDIDGEKKDLDGLKQDYNTAMSSSDSSDANQVRADANQIQADDNQIQSDVGNDIGGFKHDVQNLQNDLTTFQNDVETMNSLASQLGQILPKYLPGKSEVKDIVSKANSIIVSTTKAMNSCIAASKQMLGSANSLADKAEKQAGN